MLGTTPAPASPKTYYCVWCDRPHPEPEPTHCLDCGHDWFAISPYDVWSKLAEENVGLARSIANRWMRMLGRWFTLKIGGWEELFGHGQLALVRAAQCYDPMRAEACFATYAFTTIWQRTKQLIDASRAEKRELTLHEKYLEEMKGASGTNIEAHGNVSDWVPEREDYWGPLLETAATIRDAFKMLSIREIWVMQEMFDKERTLEELGEEEGVSKERIRQIQERAIYKLRRALNPSHPAVNQYEVNEKKKQKWYDKHRKKKKEPLPEEVAAC